MRPYEVVRAAIYHRRPPRLPVRFACFGCNDTASIPLQPAASFQPRVAGIDEWGCEWVQTEIQNMGQVKGHPLLSIADLSHSAFPDYNDNSRYSDVSAACTAFAQEGQYVTAGIFMVLFERMHTLYGFENVLCDLVLNRSAMERLADHILAVQLTLVENIKKRFGSAVHGFTMTDDWGTQQAAFISFDLWMDFFYPRYKRLFDAMHAGGYDVWVHSCGKINEIIEGFVRAGVDVVNLQQPRALGVQEIGRRYRGRITFESLADIQRTLPTNDRAQVSADVAVLMEHWALPDGGFIFSDYGDNEAIGVRDLEIKRYMYDCFSKASTRLYGNPLPEPQM